MGNQKKSNATLASKGKGRVVKKKKKLTPEEKNKELDAKLKKLHKKFPTSGKNDFSHKDDHFYSAVGEAQKWMKKYNKPDEIPDSLIPREWDFRNIGGYDFTGPVRDQLECGSCYTLGFI